MRKSQLFDVIYDRRSVRRFSSRAIPDRIMHAIMESARWAPSGGNGQKWSFGIVTDRLQRKELAGAAGGQMWIAEAPVIVACCAQLFRPDQEDDFSRRVNELRWGREMTEWIRNCDDPHWMAVLFQNSTTLIPGAHIQLAAASFGLGSCWIGYLDIDRAGAILGLPADWRCYFIMPLGYPEEDSRRTRKPLSDITFEGHWGTLWPPAVTATPFGKPQIRTYNDEDEEDWLNTWGQAAVTSYAWAALWHRKPRYERQALELVVELNSEIVGFMDVEIENTAGELGLLTDAPCGFVWEFGVRPDHQGEGIARLMIERARGWLKEQGIARMEFWSADEKAQSFYRHMGMSEIERHWQFYMKLPRPVREQLAADKVGVFTVYGNCPVDRLDTVADKYEVGKGQAEEPKICIGFDDRW